MQNTEQVQKLALRAAITIAIINFLGFSWMLFYPYIYMMGIFTPYILFGQLVLFAPVGLMESFIVGWVIYFIFKHIKSKPIYITSLIIGIMICFLLGFFSHTQFLRWAMHSPSFYTKKSDTNHDGKIDKWVFYNSFSKKVERVRLDTDYDGKIDTEEHYTNNGELWMREVDTNLDGRMDKIVYFKK